MNLHAYLGRQAVALEQLPRVLDRAAGFARARLLLHRATLGARVYAGRGVRVGGDGEIVIGDRTILHGGTVPTLLECASGARLEIGSEGIFNYGVRIEAHDRVTIGDRCRLGSMVRISDRGPAGRARVTIEDDVWIAHGAIIEPGVTVGAGSVVSAGSVVTGDVPAGRLAIGNPARSLPLPLVAAADP